LDFHDVWRQSNTALARNSVPRSRDVASAMELKWKARYVDETLRQLPSRNTTAYTFSSAVLIMTHTKVSLVTTHVEESDQDPDPEPQPIDPGMTKHLLFSLIKVNLSTGYGR
jgi:hypothetical protein